MNHEAACTNAVGLRWSVLMVNKTADTSRVVSGLIQSVRPYLGAKSLRFDVVIREDNGRQTTVRAKALPEAAYHYEA